MNLPNKLTMARIFMAILIILILLGGDYTKSLIKTGVVNFEPDKDFVEVVEKERRNNN